MAIDDHIFFDPETCRRHCPFFREHPKAYFMYHDDTRKPGQTDLWIVDGNGQVIHQCGYWEAGDSLFDNLFVEYDDLDECRGKTEVMVAICNEDEKQDEEE